MSDFLNSIIPSQPVAATISQPRVLILYSDLKVGKSTLASWLSMNQKALWLDYESGGEALPGLKINVIREVDELKKTNPKQTRVQFLLDLWSELAKSSPPRFDYVIHDKVDNLEEWAERWGTVYYKNTVIGRNFTGSTILELPEGGGYGILREKFTELWNAAVQAAPRTIFMASLKSKFVGTKGDSMVSVGDLDLTGKIRKISAGFADAIGFLYRGEDGANYVSFRSAERGAFAGNRIPRLEGQQFKVSWKEKGEVKVDLSGIYSDIEKTA